MQARMIRGAVAVVAVLASVPAWADPSVLDRLEAQRFEQRTSGTATSPTQDTTSAPPVENAPLPTDQGSGGGESSGTPDHHEQNEASRAADEQFLNQVWNAS